MVISFSLCFTHGLPPLTGKDYKRGALRNIRTNFSRQADARDIAFSRRLPRSGCAEFPVITRQELKVEIRRCCKAAAVAVFFFVYAVFFCVFLCR